MTILLAALAGVATWSFLEYVVHRWAGHSRPVLKMRFNVFGKEHTRHHSEGNYFAPAWKKAAAAVVVVPLLSFAFSGIAGLGPALGYCTGLVGFYLYYEWLHLRLHTHEAATPYGRWARRNHFFHHFHDPSLCHGVTSPIWDHVFGTHATADVIRVPEKLAMVWLCDPETGELHERHQGEWELRRSKKKKLAKAA